MKTPQRLHAPAVLTGRGLCLAAITVVACATLAAADELPSFQQGLWSFSSTVNAPGGGKPKVRTVRKCTNPTEDIKKKWEMLATKTCKFSPITRTGKFYKYSSSCEKNGLSLSTSSVITVESTSAYRVETVSHTNNQAQKEVIVAKRVGDCPK